MGQQKSARIEAGKKIFSEFVYYFLFMFLNEMGTTLYNFLPSLSIPIRTALFYLYYNCEPKPKTWLSFTRNTRVFRRKQSNSLSIIFRVGERNSYLATISRLAFRTSHSFVGAPFFFRISHFSHHFNQRIYYDKMTQTKR